MKVSIITVCFNAVETIEESILSVIGQDYADIEYIIIDGKSNDGTQNVISKYKDQVMRFLSEPDNGIYFGMNKGLELATGEVIGILNADDVYSNNEVITRVVELFKSTRAQSVYADLEYVDANNLNEIVRTWKSGEYNDSSFLEGWMLPHPTFFVKKECYEKYGLFNTSLRTSADYELMLRLLYKCGISTSYLPETIIKMRIGGVSNSSIKNRIKANIEDRKAWKINGLKPKWYTLYRKPLSKVGQFFFGKKTQ